MKLVFCIPIAVSCWLAFVPFTLHAQLGCTDPCASNYNAAASTDDGSCTYTMTTEVNLPTQLAEISGLVQSGTDLWAQADGGNPNAFYRINRSTGAILQTVTITNGTNTSTGSVTTTEDWEDIATSSTHIYLADVGNNDGNRENLKIYRVAKSSIGAGATVSVIADVINFSYPNQGMPPFASAPQANDFDCEAMVYYNGKLHLFTKNWLNNWTRHYSVPDMAGTHVATLEDSFNVAGLITGADIAPNGALGLIGNNVNTANPQVIMFYFDGFSGSDFFSGQVRQMTLGATLSLGQVESLAFMSSSEILAATESVNVTFPPFPPLIIPQRTYSLTICPFSILALWPEENKADSLSNLHTEDFLVDVKYEDNLLLVKANNSCQVALFNINGSQLMKRFIQAESPQTIPIGSISKGLYVARFISGKGDIQQKYLVVR